MIFFDEEKEVKEINDPKNMSLADLEEYLKDLNLQLFKARTTLRGAGANPARGTPTKLIKNIKKEIARTKTMINKNQKGGKK